MKDSLATIYTPESPLRHPGRLRVVHFCGAFSRLSETFIYDLINELEGRGVENHVVTFLRENVLTRPFKKVSVVPEPGRWNPLRLWSRCLVAMGQREMAEVSWPIIRRRLVSVIKRISPDIIHAYFGPRGVQIAPVAQRLDIPLVVSFLGTDASFNARIDFWRKKYLELWPVAAGFSGISEHICGRLRELGAPADKVFRISLGVNLDEFPYRNPVEHFDGKNVECLFVGRLVEKKGPLLLLKSFQIARQLVPRDLKLFLHLIGDGPLRPALEEFCEREQLENSVIIHGPQNHSEVKAMLRRAHIYVQHSITAADGDQEGQGVSLVEASAAGLPIVATRHNGFPDVVIDGITGFLVAEHDFNSMGEKIALLAKQPYLWGEMGCKGRSHVEANMNLATQAGLWMELYRNYDQRGKMP